MFIFSVNPVEISRLHSIFGFRVLQVLSVARCLRTDYKALLYHPLELPRHKEWGNYLFLYFSVSELMTETSIRISWPTRANLKLCELVTSQVYELLLNLIEPFNLKRSGSS